MHISEGVLSPSILIIGAAFTLGGTWKGLKELSPEKIPQVALLCAAFFVASLIHIPLGPSSVHLLLNGLIGLILGWLAFPALLVALFLQALLFQFGGLTTLGINTLNMALPGVIVYYLFRPWLKKSGLFSYTGAFLSGAGAVFLAGVLVATELSLTGKNFQTAAKIILIAHIPVAFIEGLITILIINFLKKVRPEILWGEGKS